jgi:hypothetical protein
LRYANGDPIVDIPEAKIHHVVLKTTEDEYNALLDKTIEIHFNLVTATINDVSSYYHQFQKALMHIRLCDNKSYFNTNSTQSIDWSNNWDLDLNTTFCQWLTKFIKILMTDVDITSKECTLNKVVLITTLPEQA